MKARKVSALRERGLRRVCGAEPQVDGDTIGRHHLNNRETPINSIERKTDTMKTYILRDPNSVEPQKAQCVQPQNSQHPSAPTSLAVSSQSSQPSPAAAPSALFIGLDVHNDSIAVSLAPSGSTEVRRYGIIGGSHDDVLRLCKKLQAAHPDATLKFCYEAGPRGYPLCRFLRAHGADCILVAPSKVPRKPGDRVKTDRRDADQLARLYRAGELTAIYVPDPQDEAVRDLLRARYQIVKQQHRARQQLKMFLLRHNIRYAGTTSWTPKHLRFLATVKLPFAEQQFLFQEMVNVISEAGQRLERYQAQLPGVVGGWRWEPVVRALMSLRGLALLNATVLVAELGDLHRFEHPGQLMSYLGLVPSEDTTSDDRKQGGITKMGNGFARRALIEAAWHYRQGPRISRGVLARQEGLPKAVADAAWNAQSRLHHRYKHLVGAGRKKPQVAAAAIARELSGFVWAIGRMLPPRPSKP
jgi:transposase